MRAWELYERRLDEFIPFTTGTAGTAGPAGGTTAPVATAASVAGRYAPEDTAKQPWEMTRNEVRALPYDQLSTLFWKPAAEHIWREAGSRDPERILDFYSRKYSLPPMGFEWSNRLPPNINGEAQKDGAGNWTVLLSPRLKSSPYEWTIVLRHEVEHVIDDVRDSFSPTVDRAITRPDGHGGLDVKDGHHKHFGEFNTDYSHRIVVRDALHQGKPVPREVLKDYPDIH